jgi:hypothetical protein
VTIDRDHGTTPFMIDCMATVGCIGMMRSSMYLGPLVKDHSIKPHYVWRKPTQEEYDGANAPMKRHFDMGGLDIYPYSELQ